MPLGGGSRPAAVRAQRARANQAQALRIDEEIAPSKRRSRRLWKAASPASLPPLFEAADQVAFYANEFAQDKAVEQANDYAHIANGIERLIKSYRDLRLQEAQEAIAFVSATAKSLAVWVLLSAFVAIVLIGPIGLATMHRVLSRLAGITQAMIRLSRHDTTTVIPSRDDRDEVGAMARAVEVFKDNAIQLIAREVELKQLNRRIDIALNNMTHGLCMFDAEQKLIVCNKTYVQMYALTAELAKPGTLLQAIENYRASDRQRRHRQSRADGGGDRDPRARGLRLHPGADGWPYRRGVAASDAGRRLGRGARGHHRAPARRSQDRASGAP